MRVCIFINIYISIAISAQGPAQGPSFACFPTRSGLMPPARTMLLLFSVLLVGTGDDGGVGWVGGVGFGRVPVWLTSPGVGQIERGVEVWGDAPGWSPLSDGSMPAFISERGGTAPPGKRTQPNDYDSKPIPSTILHSTFRFFNFLSPYIDHAARGSRHFFTDVNNIFFLQFCAIMMLFYVVYVILEFICLLCLTLSSKSPDPISASIQDTCVTSLQKTKDVRSVSKNIRKTNKSLTYVSDKDWNDSCETVSKLPFQYIGRSNTYSHRKLTQPQITHRIATDKQHDKKVSVVPAAHKHESYVDYAKQCMSLPHVLPKSGKQCDQIVCATPTPRKIFFPVGQILCLICLIFLRSFFLTHRKMHELNVAALIVISMRYSVLQ